MIYEDADLAGVVKPSGMLSEGDGSSLEAWVQARWDKRAQCCHRLDRTTSGVMLIRKNRRLNRELADLFANHRVRKCYWALTDGLWPTGVTFVDAPISPLPETRLQRVDSSGKPARTSVRVFAQSTRLRLTWLELILKTGRTHQARVHCASMDCPIWGDTAYGAAPRADLFGLHARELRFIHPLTGENVTLTADPPPRWNGVLAGLRKPKN